MYHFKRLCAQLFIHHPFAFARIYTGEQNVSDK